MKTCLLLTLLTITCQPMLAHAHTVDPEAIYYADAYADHYDVPRPLVYAIISQESGWNRTAVSDKGALGLMQLMPATARHYGVLRPFENSDNIGGGVRYLHDLLTRFRGDLRLTIAAYYTGEARVQRRGLAFHDPAVVAYVEHVCRRYQRELNRLASLTSEERP